MASRFLKLSILISTLCVGIAIRMSNSDFVFASYTGHLNFFDTDSYYYLRLLSYLLQNFPNPLIVDPLSNWPYGGDVGWPEGFLFLLAIPLKLMGISDSASLEAGVSLMMIFLGVIAAVICLIAAQRVLKNFHIAALVFFLASVNYLLVRFSCLGELDHHIIEAIIPPLAFILADKGFGASSRFSQWGLGLILALGFLISSSTLFIFGVMIAVWFFVYSKERSSWKDLLHVGFALILIMVPYVIWSYSVRNGWFFVHVPSLFHLSMISVLTLGAILARRWPKYAYSVLGGCAVLLSLSAAFKWPAGLGSTLRWAFEYAFTRAGVLGSVAEAAPIFFANSGSRISFDYINGNFGYLFYFVLLAPIALYFWRRWSVVERALLLTTSLMLIPAVAQKRFSHLVICMFLIFLGWLIERLGARYTNQSKWVIPASSLAVIGSVLIPSFMTGFAPQGAARERVDLPSIGAMIKKLDIKEEDVWKRLGEQKPTTFGVWANPNMGHAIVYTMGMGAVTNTYYQGLDTDFKLRTIETGEELVAQLGIHKIKYMMLADDFPYFEILFGLMNQRSPFWTEEDLRRGVSAKDRRIPAEALTRYAWIRLLLAEGKGDANFETLFSNRFLENHFYKFVKAIRFTAFQ